MLMGMVPPIDVTVLSFIDEFNTTNDLLGYIKEIFCDGSFEGKPLPKNIFWVAAMNPQNMMKRGGFVIFEVLVNALLFRIDCVLISYIAGQDQPQAQIDYTGIASQVLSALSPRLTVRPSPLTSFPAP